MREEVRQLRRHKCGVESHAESTGLQHKRFDDDDLLAFAAQQLLRRTCCCNLKFDYYYYYYCLCEYCRRKKYLTLNYTSS